MKFPRTTIARMIAWVAVVAVNLAVGRAIFAYDQRLLCGLSLMGIALQLAGFRLIYTRRLARAFWAGFIIVGVGVSYSFICLFTYKSQFPEISLLGWVVWNAWEGYGRMVDSGVRRMPYGNLSLQPRNLDLLSCVVFSVAIFIPQLVIALAGGLLARQIARWWIIRSESGDGAANVPSPVD